MIKMNLLIIAVRSKILINLFLPRISFGKFRECSHFKENHYSTSVLLIKGIGRQNMCNYYIDLAAESY